MTTVFLSGSRAISHLNDLIRGRIRNMTGQGFRIIIGDANGADKALQIYLSEIDYRNVNVYCAGSKCRNNIGNWEVKQVQTDPNLKGRAFYTQKDLQMAGEADFGFVLWDGKSAGSINNVFELLKRKKSVVVYFSKTKTFINISLPHQLNDLLDACNEADFRSIDKKVNVNRNMKELEAAQQGAFNL
ncbi:MAG: hypothetical protein O3A84_10830 [Proteobacteria bacterium]|nr:hypothetical protein [Pseudomonadota bacterium]